MKTGNNRIPDPVILGDVAWEVATSDPPKFIPTGIAELDDLIVGVENQQLTIIAGSPSQGKTALGIQIAEHAAAVHKVRTGIFTLEMSPQALSMRLIAAHSGVSVLKQRRRAAVPLTDDEQQRVEAAADYLKSLPIALDTRSGLNGEQVYETVRYWKNELGIGLVLLDYIQLMEGESENRQETVGANTRQLKNAARDFDVPFIALSQVSRASNQREDKKPRMSDLRDSGQIEQVGDTILMFHYPEDDAMNDIRVCDIYAVKQRQGPVGFASVFFDKPSTRFVDKPPQEKAEPAAETPAGVPPAKKVWGNHA